MIETIKKNWFLFALLLVGIGVGILYLRNRESTSERELVSQLVESEELLLALTPELKKLNQSAMNLRLGDHHSLSMFADELKLYDIQSLAGEGGNQKLEVASSAKTLRPADTGIWQALFDGVDYFENAKFYLISGTINAENQFESQMGFAGLAKNVAGHWNSIKIKSAVTWTNETPENEQSEWKIASWKTKRIEISESNNLYFREVSNECLPRPFDLYRARTSKHDEYVVAAVKTGRISLANERYRRYFFITAAGQHPGLSVADVDGDGWDDIYVMIRWGKNLLFHNQGNGTFVEAAKKFGLDVDGVSTGGVFADFDNDGDLDLFLGRTLERSAFFVNDNNVFRDVTKQRIAEPPPYLVTSVSAVDYNNDGLLDIYLSTYGMPGRGESGARKWAPEFLNPQQAKKMVSMYSDPKVEYNRFMNAVGPPNVLLVNRGGRFEVAPENEQIQQWYNTLQATWADFDLDGDPDLYVANDFAPDALYQNGGADGFKNITVDVGHATMQGFGMGAGWGDYDNDGFQDLYVSNMYSKAGMRITGQLPGLDNRFRMSANGNRLYRFDGESFQLVSGNDDGNIHVTKAGWSWGGQFLDVDNDGYQDIYVTSGYRTVPPEVATDVDL